MVGGRSLTSLCGSFTLRRLTGASAVLIGATIAGNLLRLGSTLLLTRLLSPGDFGLIAIVSSIFFIIAMITDAGFEAYIVRHERGEEPDFLDSIWSIHFGRGLGTAAIAAALAFPLAQLMHKPQLAPLLAVAAASLAIDGAASLTLLTALRRNLVRRLAMIDVFGQFCQFVVGVTLAWALHSAWALVTSLLVGSLVRTAASYLVFPDSRRRVRLDPSLTLDLWRFSRIIAASSILTLVISQLDKLVLARVMPLKLFGIYAIATNLAAAPLALVGQYMSRIFYPAVAARWRTDPGTIGRYYYGLRGPVFFAYLVGGGLLIGAAPLIVHILYDPRYLQAGFYLRLLAVTTTLTMLTRAANDALVAIGETRVTLTANLVRIAWLLPIGLGAFLAIGPVGLVAAIAFVEVPAGIYQVAVLVRLHLFDLRKELVAWSAIVAGIGAGLAMEGLASFLSHL